MNSRSRWQPSRQITDYQGPYPIQDLERARLKIIDRLLYPSSPHLIALLPKIGIDSRYADAYPPKPLGPAPDTFRNGFQYAQQRSRPMSAQIHPAPIPAATNLWPLDLWHVDFFGERDLAERRRAAASSSSVHVNSERRVPIPKPAHNLLNQNHIQTPQPTSKKRSHPSSYQTHETDYVERKRSRVSGYSGIPGDEEFSQDHHFKGGKSDWEQG